MSTFTPPPASWRLPAFLEASPEDLKVKLVDCPTCPVREACKAGMGGTGWVCKVCRATGVWVDPPKENAVPADLIVMDCGIHNFEKKRQTGEIASCAMCSGAQVVMETLTKTRNHYVFTVHAEVPVRARQAMFRHEAAALQVPPVAAPPPLHITHWLDDEGVEQFACIECKLPGAKTKDHAEFIAHLRVHHERGNNIPLAVITRWEARDWLTKKEPA